MSAISKELFYAKVGNEVSCDLIHYWNKNCIQSLLSPYFFVNIIKGSGRFFLPIYLLRAFLDYKRKRKHILKRFIENETLAILYSFSMAGVLIASICFFRKIFGRLHYHSLIFVPGFISGITILILPKEEQIMASLVFFNSFIETLLNKLGLSRKQELFLFMCLSGILMQLFENRAEKFDFSYFWFYTPCLPKINDQNDKSKCRHEENCNSYLYQGIVNYFLVGYGINITRSFLSKFHVLSKNPTKIFELFFNRSNSDFGLFIAAYVGLYRFVSCYLVKSETIITKWRGVISGFLAGLTYTICPTLQVSVLASTTILQILYDIVSKQLKISSHFYQKLLLFCFCHGYNLKEKFYFPDTSSPYYFKMVDACSHNLTRKVYKDLFEKYML